MSLTISINNGMMNIPNHSFLFGNVSVDSEVPAKEVGKEQAYSVTISQEGLEKLKQNTTSNTMGVEKADQYRSILSKAQIDVAGSIEADFHHRYTKLNTETINGNMNAEDFAKNALSVYAEMYDEIKRGYADGTREIYIADKNAEFGYRRATEEEEIAALDAAFDFHVSYTEAYLRFVNEDKDAMYAAIQRSQDRSQAAREKRDARTAEAQYQARMDKLKEKVENNRQPVQFADLMKQSRGYLKTQYGVFANNFAELLDNVFDKLHNEFRV